MLKLLAASDCHGSCYAQRFALMAKYADQAVFLGDVWEDALEIERELGAQIIKVPGNCDFFSREEHEIVLTLEKTRILITHGDRYGVKYGLSRIAYRAEELGASLVLFGHTHIPLAEYSGNVMLINPGALKDRRYAEICIDGGRITPKLLTL